MTARYLALGDSYTIGEGVAPAERWPAQLVAALRARGRLVDDPVIVARTGWTTAELRDAVDASLGEPGSHFGLVSLLIGVNDQYRGLGLEPFRAGFQQLVERAVVHAGRRAGHVLVLSIPDWGVTPFGAADRRGSAAIGAEIDLFNGAARERTLAAGAHFVDVTACSRAAGEQPSLLAKDGLHPSGAMYAKWVSLMLPVASAILDA